MLVGAVDVDRIVVDEAFFFFFMSVVLQIGGGGFVDQTNNIT